MYNMLLRRRSCIRYNKNIFKSLTTFPRLLQQFDTPSGKITSTSRDEEKPVKFSSSPAAEWKAQYRRLPPDPGRARFTPEVVTISVSAFLLYFLCLREENDIDEIIYRPLPETIQGIDKQFPQFDFYTKPDYVQFWEERKKEKLNKKALKANEDDK